jgi:ribosomal protein S6
MQDSDLTKCELVASLTNLPITPCLLSAYQSSHKKYKEAVESEKAEKVSKSVLGKRQLPMELKIQFKIYYRAQAKKREWEEKQEQAEKLIWEGADGITAALKAGKMTDVLSAQALLVSRNIAERLLPRD